MKRLTGLVHIFHYPSITPSDKQIQRIAVSDSFDSPFPEKPTATQMTKRPMHEILWINMGSI